MYFDRPTLFANEEWCATRAPRRALSWEEFFARVRARVATADEYPDIVRSAFRNVSDHSSEHEYDLAVDTVARDIQSRRDHVKEMERRRRQTLRRNVPIMRMERRANGE